MADETGRTGTWSNKSIISLMEAGGSGVGTSIAPAEAGVWQLRGGIRHPARGG